MSGGKEFFLLGKREDGYWQSASVDPWSVKFLEEPTEDIKAFISKFGPEKILVAKVVSFELLTETEVKGIKIEGEKPPGD